MMILLHLFGAFVFFTMATISSVFLGIERTDYMIIAILMIVLAKLEEIR